MSLQGFLANLRQDFDISETEAAELEAWTNAVPFANEDETDRKAKMDEAIKAANAAYPTDFGEGDPNWEAECRESMREHAA